MQHVMLDLYGCSPSLLENEAFLRDVLDQYPTHIGMQKVGPIELRYIETNNPLDDGFSGFVIIATSHVSLLISSRIFRVLSRIQRTYGPFIAFVIASLSSAVLSPLRCKQSLSLKKLWQEDVSANAITCPQLANRVQNPRGEYRREQETRA